LGGGAELPGDLVLLSYIICYYPAAIFLKKIKVKSKKWGLSSFVLLGLYILFCMAAPFF
jgi:hypothetical protein